MELAIVNNIVHASGYDPDAQRIIPENVEYRFEAAAEIINAAYAAGGRARNIDAIGLRMAWHRYSHMREWLLPRHPLKVKNRFQPDI